MAPTFLGSEPVHTQTGKYAGNVILQDEQSSRARSLTQAFVAAEVRSGRREMPRNPLPHVSGYRMSCTSSTAILIGSS